VEVEQDTVVFIGFQPPQVLDLDTRLMCFNDCAKLQAHMHLYPPLHRLIAGRETGEPRTSSVRYIVSAIDVSCAADVIVKHFSDVPDSEIAACVDRHMAMPLVQLIRELFVDTARYPFTLDNNGRICFGLGELNRYFGRVQQVVKPNRHEPIAEMFY
jgi:hypothetical protein